MQFMLPNPSQCLAMWFVLSCFFEACYGISTNAGSDFTKIKSIQRMKTTQLKMRKLLSLSRDDTAGHALNVHSHG